MTRSTSWWRSAVLGATLVLVAAAGAACGDGGSPDPGGTGTAGPVPNATTPTTPGDPTADPSPDTAAWTTGPVSVTHQVTVPPVPRLLRIRSAAHPGYDRIVFDFAGPALPGYQVRYVDTVVEDGSGQTVTMPGRRYLQIRFEPAQAHDDSGTAVTPRRATLAYPMLRGYVINGDFEAVLSVALGLDDVVGFRVGEIAGTPARVYVDVAA